ncbi:hypothetical protein ACFQ3P_20810 [Paraburkholderia sabiae]|uniref:Uncharacterized protein n=1 Tax=Paraburkholderia sabiae TaxID=273251 RepID=A0ABU9QJU7_9BURK|nr:hypothetical protein [Paraburkholderia sabiae]WJZ73462.1 hypothetical protein QEN71_25525 [Paraburkholderia sabiae]CAD6542386.1 hypothetical protein LMG24235_03783 [Paraburkholderia sabiae]
MTEIHAAVANDWLQDRAREVAEAEGWDETAQRILIPKWQFFTSYVLTYGEIPGSLSDIRAETLTAFSRHCDLDGGVPFAEAPLMLAAVRLVLLRSGYDTEVLAALSAPRRRKRVRNKGKTYRHEITRPDDPACAKAAASSPGTSQADAEVF